MIVYLRNKYTLSVDRHGKLFASNKVTGVVHFNLQRDKLFSVKI